MRTAATVQASAACRVDPFMMRGKIIGSVLRRRAGQAGAALAASGLGRCPASSPVGSGSGWCRGRIRTRSWCTSRRSVEVVGRICPPRRWSVARSVRCSICRRSRCRSSSTAPSAGRAPVGGSPRGCSLRMPVPRPVTGRASRRWGHRTNRLDVDEPGLPTSCWVVSVCRSSGPRGAWPRRSGRRSRLVGWPRC